jgi:phospholipid N-methyltransferase
MNRETSGPAGETDAVRARYARRSAAADSRRYGMVLPANWQAVQERQRAILRLFAHVGFDDLTSLKLIEVGAGGGGNLLELLRAGFQPENLRGVELLPERAAQARRILPSALQFTEGDALALDVEPGSADIVFQSVVFSSLLDNAFQARLAHRMWDWVRPGGGVLWYDFVYDNPSNRDVRGVPLSRVRELFPGGVVTRRRVTLAPPIARRVCAVHPALYTLFNAVPLLRTHLLCWIEKP